MAFNSDKWALSFYGVVDENFHVETDMFQLHIWRKNGTERLVAKRGEGTLDIFIPQTWEMDKYKYQEQLRRFLLSEVKKQAKTIFTQRTMYFANRYNIPCEKIELEHRYRYIGKCDRVLKLVKYNPWIICCCGQRHIDYLVCHELAHFYHNDHSTAFWQMAEQLYFGLDIHVQTTGSSIRLIRSELSQNMVLTILRYWGQSSYLKDFFWNGLVKNKKPLIVPHYVKTPNGEKIDAIYTTFAIRF